MTYYNNDKSFFHKSKYFQNQFKMFVLKVIHHTTLTSLLLFPRQLQQKVTKRNGIIIRNYALRDDYIQLHSYLVWDNEALVILSDPVTVLFWIALISLTTLYRNCFCSSLFGTLELLNSVMSASPLSATSLITVRFKTCCLTNKYWGIFSHLEGCTFKKLSDIKTSPTLKSRDVLASENFRATKRLVLKMSKSLAQQNLVIGK